MSEVDQLSLPEVKPSSLLAESPSTAPKLPAPPPVRQLTRDFLAWVASRPRSYAETMDAWRTSCPRFTIWEDALGDGLVQLESVPGMPMSETRVVLGPRGRAILDGA
jgi:hypothetical protein